jgi:hypothetical protein
MLTTALMNRTEPSAADWEGPMRRGSMWARSERIAFLVWLTVSAAACTGWQTVEVSPEQLITERHPAEIRVTLTDSTQLRLEQPSMAGDTLVGYSKGHTSTVTVTPSGYRGGSTTATEVQVGPAHRIPAADIARVETSHTDAGATIALVIGVAALVVVVAGAALAFGMRNY